MNRPGRLIVIEGIDGAGKSTVAAALVRRWRRRGYRVSRWREPRDARLGRAALERSGSDPRSAAMLFSLDRLLARPALEGRLRRPGLVLQDRSFFSTLAYQGARLAPEERSRLARLQLRLTVPPDRVLWLDVSPATALARIRGRGRRRSAVERLRTLRAVRAAYRSLARAPRWIRVDASGPPREVVEAADRALEPWLRRSRRRAG